MNNSNLVNKDFLKLLEINTAYYLLIYDSLKNKLLTILPFYQ